MSKSLGNVIDPIDVIEGITLEGLNKTLEKGNLDPSEKTVAFEGQKKDFPKGISECGTDALRFGLCAYCHGKDIFLDIKRIEAYRNFCNKIWNATKLAWMYLKDDYMPSASRKLTGTESPIDLWILHRLNATIKNLIISLEAFEIGQATTALYDFWLYDTCDFYLESIKPVMNGSDETAKTAICNTLYIILDEGYKILSPFMPFITEELWQRLPRRSGDFSESICVSEYPAENPEWFHPKIDDEIILLQKIIKTARSLLAELGFVKSAKPVIIVSVPDEQNRSLLEKYRGTFIVLTYIGNFEVDINVPIPGEVQAVADVLGTQIKIYYYPRK
jgi:valyl-tRNA synthetase